MIQKRLLVRERVRRPPDMGWSWIDRRFVREYAEHLSREVVLLYFVLAAVADPCNYCRHALGDEGLEPPTSTV